MSNEASATESPQDRAVMDDMTRAKVEAMLNSKTPGGGKCPICGPGIYTIAQHFVSPMIVTPDGGTIVGGPSYPNVMLICSFCGHVRLHNAVITGIMVNSPESPTNE